MLFYLFPMTWWLMWDGQLDPIPHQLVPAPPVPWVNAVTAGVGGDGEVKALASSTAAGERGGEGEENICVH